MAIKLETSVSYEEIILNTQGDSVFISLEDSTFFDRFVNSFKYIIEKAEENDKSVKDIEEKYRGKEEIKDHIDMVSEISAVNVKFSTEATSIVDGIFGEGTVRMYFRNIYEKVPSFLPNADCFIEFYEKLVPAMEQLFNRNAEAWNKASKARMAKYQPQDHKKPTSRATKATKK